MNCEKGTRGSLLPARPKGLQFERQRGVEFLRKAEGGGSYPFLPAKGSLEVL